MPVEDVFSITGRGTVATGRIETEVAATGDPVEIIGMGAEKLTSTITELRCSVRFLTEEKLEITLVFFKRYSKEDIKEEWLFVSQVQLSHTPFKAEGIS
jgi:elongation factor Tu